MKPVVIFGTGDFARVAAVYLQEDSPYEVAGFTVHQQYINQPTLIDLDIFPFEQLVQTHPPEQYAMFVAVGFKRVNKARAEVYGTCKTLGYELISYICSEATQWGHIEIGDNTFVFEDNVIQPFAKLGNDVVLWSGNHIGHDAVIGDHCFVASHAVVSGNVTIGTRSFIGVNATIRDGVRVARDNVIGAGALILGDTKPGEVYAGNGTQALAIQSDQLKSFK